MDGTLVQILSELYQKDQALIQLAQKVQELQAELDAAKQPPAEPPEQAPNG